MTPFIDLCFSLPRQQHSDRKDRRGCLWVEAAVVVVVDPTEIAVVVREVDLEDTVDTATMKARQEITVHHQIIIVRRLKVARTLDRRLT